MTTRKPNGQFAKEPAPVLRTLGERLDAMQEGLTAWEQETAAQIAGLSEAATVQKDVNGVLSTLQDEQRKELSALKSELNRVSEMYALNCQAYVRRFADLAQQVDTLEKQAIEAADELEALKAHVNRPKRTWWEWFKGVVAQ